MSAALQRTRNALARSVASIMTCAAITSVGTIPVRMAIAGGRAIARNGVVNNLASHLERAKFMKGGSAISFATQKGLVHESPGLASEPGGICRTAVAMSSAGTVSLKMPNVTCAATDAPRRVKAT